jgi:hypothetical protein
MEAITQFEKNLQGFTTNEVDDFFDLLQRLLEESGWSAGDERLVFTAAQNGELNFSIGPRHCLKLMSQGRNKTTVLKFISQAVLDEVNSTHTFSGGPEAYLYEATEIEKVRKNWSSFSKACQDEYARSKRSPHRNSNDEAFERAAFDTEYSKQFFSEIHFKPSFEMDFFTQEELDVFNASVGQGYDKDSAEDKRKFNLVKNLYVKLGYWAKEAQKIAFPSGKTNIRRQPLNNNGTVFMKYLWAQVYPSSELAKQKTLAFTISIDAGKRFDVKIDTVGQKEGEPIREQYLAWRGDYFNSPYVKIFPFENVLQYNWEELINKAAAVIRELTKDYYHFYNMIQPETNGQQMTVNRAISLNQILYGPPGTGKTYATKAQAVAILDGALPNTRSAINQRYQELVRDKRITFVTFHQSSTYEDFVEGIKPVMGADEEEGDLRYQIEDGIFKRMCVEATYEFVKRQNKEQAAGKTLDFSQRLDQLLNQFQQQLDDGAQIEIPQRSRQQIRVEEISKQGNFILRHVDGDRTYTVSQNRLEKLFNAIDDFDQIPNIYAYFRSIIGGSNASAYWAILNQLYQQEATTPASAEQSSSVVDYAIKQQAFYRMNWQEASDAEVLPKYLMIIDEINRGNVAAIFGELITLLEEDKRGGKEEYLSVSLPYSKEKLVVPPNLYLIGTMNTADRSVEALDTALRRRFSFTEVEPQPGLLAEIEIDGLNLADMLRTINHRIELLLDKDHCIGHAYFMDIAKADEPGRALREVFAQKVLPLLEEYFFGATGKIQLVLGPAFCPRQEIISEKSPFASNTDYGDGEYENREIYRTADVMNMPLETFKTAVRAITA